MVEVLKSYHSQLVTWVLQGKASFMSGYSAVRQQESRRDLSKAFCRHGYFFYKSTHKNIWDMCSSSIYMGNVTSLKTYSISKYFNERRSFFSCFLMFHNCQDVIFSQRKWDKQEKGSRDSFQATGTPLLITVYLAMNQLPLLKLDWQLPCYPHVQFVKAAIILNYS